jgi:hypothetical protein
MEKATAIVDYAYPCMMAEGGLKAVHNAMLHNDFDTAIEAAIQTLADTRLMLAAIRDMQEKSGAV